MMGAESTCYLHSHCAKTQLELHQGGRVKLIGIETSASFRYSICAMHLVHFVDKVACSN